MVSFTVNISIGQTCQNEKWTRLVLITAAYFDDLQAVGNCPKDRDEMMKNIDVVIRKAGMTTHPWTICNPTGKEMPMVPPTSDEIANYPKILGYWVNLFPKVRGAYSGPALKAN